MFIFNANEARFKMGRVALVVFGASVGLLVFNYLLKFVYGTPFNWEVYWDYFPNQLLGTATITLFSYLMLNWLFTLFRQRKGFTAFLPPLLLCLVLIQGYNLAIDYLLPLESNKNNPLPLGRQVVGNLVVALIYMVFVLVITIIYYLGDVRKHNQWLEEQKLKWEVEKMQADMKFLKLQINPHFLHNTLNSFYARSLPLSKELADGILTLSEMMRHALGEANTSDGKVWLSDELRHVRNFIRIQQFRFRNELQVIFEINGAEKELLIIPFVLITLVENIFKHGDLMDVTSPCLIRIDIQEDHLRYESWNRKKQGPKEWSTGIGMENIQKRLALAYGDACTLHIKDEADTYSVELKISGL